MEIYNITSSTFLNMLILLALSLISLLLVNYIFKKILRTVFIIVARRSKSKFDDILISNKTPKYITYLVPLYISYLLTPIVFKDFTQTGLIIMNFIEILFVLSVVFILKSFLIFI